MEGPSLKAVADTLLKFEGETIISASGNAKIEFNDLFGQKIDRIFTIGKLLFIKTERLSVKIHFLMFGSYRINENREGMKPRLSLFFETGYVHFYNCAVRNIDNELIENQFDEELDIISPEWKPKKAVSLARKKEKEFICDVLLDQEVFTGVGNIIKNEALFLAHIHPLSVVGKIPSRKLEELTRETRRFSRLFYETRRSGQRIGGIQKIYRKKRCSLCHEKVMTKRTGQRNRRSHFCPQCQILYT